MIKMVCAYKEDDLLNEFLFRQIREANLDDVVHSSFSIDKNPELVEKHDITKWQTVIFKDINTDEEVIRIDQPYTSSELERASVHAKRILENRR